MRIHAASQILGSIWVILDEEPNELQVKTLVEAAGVAAMSLLRAKLAADSARRLRLGEVITLLSGGTSAKEAAERLGYGRSKATVLAAGFRGGAGASLEAEATSINWPWHSIPISTRYFHCRWRQRSAAPSTPSSRTPGIRPTTTTCAGSRRSSQTVPVRRSRWSSESVQR